MFHHHSLIPWGSFRVDKKKNGDHFGLGSFGGQFGDHFRVGDHFGVGIISGSGSFRGLYRASLFVCLRFLIYLFIYLFILCLKKRGPKGGSRREGPRFVYIPSKDR